MSAANQGELLKGTTMRTGSDYLAMLRKRSCEIYIGGELVEDVTVHPAFANVCRTVASLYDTAADPANQADLTHVDPETGKRYNNMWLRPRTRADLDARNRLHTAWAGLSWGMLGRSPDHVAGWIAGMACNPESFDIYGEGRASNLMRYFDYARENDLYIAYAIVPPAGVKSTDAVVAKAQTSVPNARWGSAAGLQVVDERPDGIVVSGFKILATGAVLADEILFGNFQSLAEGQERFAATFALPVGTPGMTLWSRRPFAMTASSELDDPLAFRYDETDVVVYCENVLVPWDRVLTHNHVDMARAAFSDTPAHILGNAQAHIRLLAKMRLILGVIKKVTEVNALIGLQPVRDTLSNLAVQVAMLEGLIEAENAKPETWKNGYISQDRQAMYATMAWSTTNYQNFINSVRELLGSHPFQQPADVSVFDNPRTSELYSRFVMDEPEQAVERYKLMRLAWDLVGTEYASRHSQYELFYNGAQFVNRMRVWHFFRWDVVEKEAERALSSLGGYRELVLERAGKPVPSSRTAAA
jgi:4-hydroxyphenylacetate 3-monooxygenase